MNDKPFIGPCAKYIDLVIIKNSKEQLHQEEDITRATLHGGVDEILWQKAEVYDKFISGHLAKVYSKFISRGQMQLRLEIWQRFMTSLLVGIWQRFIPSLLVADRCS